MDFKNKKLIIFDFDGTLINSVPDIASSVNRMLSHYDLNTLSMEKISSFIGNGVEPLIERALIASNNDNKTSVNDALNTYMDYYRGLTCNETFLYDNVYETLNYLHKKSYTLVICTNKPFELVEPILVKLNMKHFFEDWIGEKSLATKKPDPAPLNHLINKFNVTAEETVMVGDSKNDIIAAQNAKTDSIGVSYGYNYEENIADYNPTIVVDNFIELQNIF